MNLNMMWKILMDMILITAYVKRWRRGIADLTLNRTEILRVYDIVNLNGEDVYFLIDT